ncbi:DUF3040 domain-containing protein [Nocardioides sp.]|uniref:DUF3040 domain-containing protein n=1 Tax=Nocardioides sp. TaxID=35761 RepID=UPI003D0B1A34
MDPQTGWIHDNEFRAGEEDVPLSEEELRLLEQMERALVEEDPKFASALRGTSFRRNARRRAIVAGVVFVAGVVGLMAGAVLSIAPLGIAGFVVMLLSATVGLTAIRGQSNQATTTESGEAHPGLRVVDGGRSRNRRSRNQSRGSFMDRIEERWRRRRENGF